VVTIVVPVMILIMILVAVPAVIIAGAIAVFSIFELEQVFDVVFQH
jgi:uncharacterized sodium:solute symporter family permease YidK